MTQSVLITITNALCWLPSSAIYIASATMDLLIWNGIPNNPLNSVVNPVIFYLVPLDKQFMRRNSCF